MIINFTDLNIGMELPTVMQNIGLALITAFIPIAIFMFSQIKEEEDEYGVLDKTVLIDYVVRIKDLIWQCSLIFLPLLLWDINFIWLRISIFIAWCFGVFLVGQNLTGPYRWIRKDKLEFRLNYLKKLKPGDELPKLWASVWNSSGKDPQNDDKFFQIFLSVVDELLIDTENINNLNILEKLFNDLHTFIEKKPFILLTSPGGVFSKVLYWHFLSWQREYAYMNQDPKLDLFGKYMSISLVLDSIVSSITDRALKDSFSYGYFELMNKHVKRYENDFVVGKKIDHYYIESLLTIFYNIYLSNIEDAPNRFDIWKHYFPKNWLITKENISDPKNIASKATWNNYFYWIRDKIKLPQGSKIELDMSLDSISKEIFPTVDPFFWGAMITLVFRPWGDDGRIKSLIEYPRNFGHVGRIHTSWTNDGDENKAMQKIVDSREEEMKNSIELLLVLFPGEFTKAKISEYISELNNLDYKTNTKEYSRKKEMLTYFDDILDFIKVDKKI